MRDFIGDNIHIDGRMICYRIATAEDYLTEKGWSEKKIEKFTDQKDEAYTLLNQIIALKQACFLFRRVSYSCGSLAEDLYSLKVRLIRELKDIHQFEFDEDMVERLAGEES